MRRLSRWEIRGTLNSRRKPDPPMILCTCPLTSPDETSGSILDIARVETWVRIQWSPEDMAVMAARERMREV